VAYPLATLALPARALVSVAVEEGELVGFLVMGTSAATASLEADDEQRQGRGGTVRFVRAEEVFEARLAHKVDPYTAAAADGAGGSCGGSARLSTAGLVGRRRPAATAVFAGHTDAAGDELGDAISRGGVVLVSYANSPFASGREVRPTDVFAEAEVAVGRIVEHLARGEEEGDDSDLESMHSCRSSEGTSRAQSASGSWRRPSVPWLGFGGSGDAAPARHAPLPTADEGGSAAASGSGSVASCSEASSNPPRAEDVYSANYTGRGSFPPSAASSSTGRRGSQAPSGVKEGQRRSSKTPQLPASSGRRGSGTLPPLPPAAAGSEATSASASQQTSFSLLRRTSNKPPGATARDASPPPSPGGPSPPGDAGGARRGSNDPAGVRSNAPHLRVQRASSELAPSSVAPVLQADGGDTRASDESFRSSRDGAAASAGLVVPAYAGGRGNMGTVALPEGVTRREARIGLSAAEVDDLSLWRGQRRRGRRVIAWTFNLTVMCGLLMIIWLYSLANEELAIALAWVSNIIPSWGLGFALKVVAEEPLVVLATFGMEWGFSRVPEDIKVYLAESIVGRYVITPLATCLEQASCGRCC